MRFLIGIVMALMLFTGLCGGRTDTGAELSGTNLLMNVDQSQTTVAELAGFATENSYFVTNIFESKTFQSTLFDKIICPSNDNFVAAVTNINAYPIIPLDENPPVGDDQQKRDGGGDVMEYGTMSAAIAALITSTLALRKNKANKSVYDQDNENLHIDSLISDAKVE